MAVEQRRRNIRRQTNPLPSEMKLLRAEIKNFRSIADLKISFEPKCRILIGINESGKSNILRALHLLDPEVTIQPSDLRIERMDEPQVVDGWVRFVFSLDAEEVQDLATAVAAIFEKSALSHPLLQTDKGPISAEQWINATHQGIHMALLPSGKRSSTTWAASASTKILPGWVRNKSSTPYEIVTGETTTVIAPACFGWVGDALATLPETLEHASVKQLYAVLTERVGAIVTKHLPKCIFWKYSDQYLLPSTIDVTSFCNSPNTCVPLKSMFELAGYDMVTLLATITKARQQGQYRYSQILEKTASAATKHIRGVWKDYGTVRLKLESNGEALIPMVTDDQVPLDMANRSDGFKRFVSFLLQISAKVRTSELQDALILVDEPEIALHPSGCRHLLEELVKIGDSNATVFSTHSIFMIDKENIERHLVVEKKSEVTTVWMAEKSRIQDEEVLYSAMGYSVFETLKPKNVIFEGWRDKYVFNIAKDAMVKGDPDLKLKLASVGTTHATGVKDVRNVAKFMELAGRPCLIVSDADAPALQHKRQYEEPTAWGEWKTLQDIYGPGPVVTAEDLITSAAVIKRANKFRTTIAGLAAATEATISGPRPTLSALTAWLQAGGLDGQALADATFNLKAALFENLRRSELRDEAELLVRFVVEHPFQ